MYVCSNILQGTTAMDFRFARQNGKTSRCAQIRVYLKMRRVYLKMRRADTHAQYSVSKTDGCLKSHSHAELPVIRKHHVAATLKN